MLVLIVSALWGLRYALFTAFIATAAFNYYFLPPIRTFTIAGTQNWIALLAFLTTAVIASQLSDRARKQTEEAVGRRRELERLYSFSQQLLTADNVLQLLNAVPEHVVESFGVSAAAVYVPEKGNIYRSGIDTPGLDADQLKSIIARGEAVVDSAAQPEFHSAEDGSADGRRDGRCRQPFPPDAGCHGKPDRHRSGTRQRSGNPNPFRGGSRRRKACVPPFSIP